MPSSEPFKGRHFQSDLILLNVRWYLGYSLSYRDVEEMMLERGIRISSPLTTRGGWANLM